MSSHKLRVGLVSAIGGMAVGAVVTAAGFALWSDSDTSLPKSASASSASPLPYSPLEGAQTSSGGPTSASSEGPPPVAPIPPPMPPLPAPTGPSQPGGPASFVCTVRLLPGPAGPDTVLLAVEAPPEVPTVWGIITSDSDRTGGPIPLNEGRGEQVVSGFDRDTSEVVIYADPSMSPGMEACRSD